MHLEPNSYFIKPIKTNHQGEPQTTRHKQAPGDETARRLRAAEEARQEHPQESVENGVHKTTSIVWWRQRHMLLQASWAGQNPHCYQRWRLLLPPHMPDPAFCSPGCSCTHTTQGVQVEVNPWWKSIVPPRVASSGLALWTPHHMVTSIFLVLSLVPASPGCQQMEILLLLLPPHVTGIHTWGRMGLSWHSHSCAESLLVKRPHVSREPLIHHLSALKFI